MAVAVRQPHGRLELKPAGPWRHVRGILPLAPALPRGRQSGWCLLTTVSAWLGSWRFCEGTLGGHELWEAGLHKGEAHTSGPKSICCLLYHLSSENASGAFWCPT